MLKTLETLIRAVFAEADEELGKSSAMTLLAQHLREAKAELATRKAYLAQLIAQGSRDARHLSDLHDGLDKRRGEARVALAARNEELTQDIADDIIRLQDKIVQVEEEDRRRTAQVDRSRADLADAERLYAELSDQLRLSRTKALSPRRDGPALNRAMVAARNLADRDEAQDDLAAAYGVLDQSATDQQLDAKLNASGLFDNQAERRNEIIDQLKNELEGESK